MKKINSTGISLKYFHYLYFKKLRDFLIALGQYLPLKLLLDDGFDKTKI